MASRKGATSVIYVGGALIGINGLIMLSKGKTGLGIALVAIAVVLVVQRLIRNRRGVDT